MNRFGKNSKQEIEQASSSNKRANTVKTEKYVVRQFEQFWAERSSVLNNDKNDENICKIFEDWAFNIRKLDGTDYKEAVVKTVWNLTAKHIQLEYTVNSVFHHLYIVL